MAGIERSQGRFFWQETLDEDFELLTCTGTGDVAIPSGDETPAYCPDPAEVGNFVIDAAIEGEAGFVTYSLVRPLQSTLNYLITHLHNCKFHGRVNWSAKGGVPDIFDDYIVGLHLHNCRVTNRTVSQPTIIEPGENERVNTNADLNAWDYAMVYQNMGTRITLTEISAINDLAFDKSKTCETEEIGGDLIGKEGYFTTDHTATSPAVSADVWYTTDYGATWTACATDPFAAAEDAGAVQTRGGRVIVARLDTDAGNPAEIAYSDDYGATWTNVNVGAVNGQTVTGLWWLDWTHLWASATGGYVYFSADAGETWTAQTSGGLTAQNLMDICAYDRQNVWAVGAAGALIRTVDGTNWAACTGPAAVADQFNTVFMINSTRVLIGSDAGNVYRTNDGGATAGNWTTLGTPQWSGGEVKKIRGELRHRYFIYIIGDTSGSLGEVYRSENGGQRFKEVDDFPVNSGLNGLDVIDHNVAWTGGEVHSATAFLAKIHETS